MKKLMMVFIITSTVAVLSAQDKSPSVQSESAEPAKVENSLAVGCDYQNKTCGSSHKRNCAFVGKKCESQSKCDHKKSSGWMFWKKSETKACCINK